MALLKEQKDAVIGANKTHETDTGSPEVQIAVLTESINTISLHLRTHKHDFHTLRGLQQKLGRRSSLLKYLARKDINRYRALVSKLGIRGRF